VSGQLREYSHLPSRYASIRSQRHRWVHTGGQPYGAEGYACNDSGLEYSATDACVVGRNRSEAQSAPSGLDCVLRVLFALGSASAVPVRQYDAAGVGATEVQALQATQSSRCLPPGKASANTPRTLRALAAQHARRVCLMGAE